MWPSRGGLHVTSEKLNHEGHEGRDTKDTKEIRNIERPRRQANPIKPRINAVTTCASEIRSTGWVQTFKLRDPELDVAVTP